MSQRLGMADGRCFTIHTNAQLLNDAIMTNMKIPLQNNYAYRKHIQKVGPEVIDSIHYLQESEPRAKNSVSCLSCDMPLLKVTTPY